MESKVSRRRIICNPEKLLHCLYTLVWFSVKFSLPLLYLFHFHTLNAFTVLFLLASHSPTAVFEANEIESSFSQLLSPNLSCCFHTPYQGGRPPFLHHEHPRDRQGQREPTADQDLPVQTGAVGRHGRRQIQPSAAFCQGPI